MLPNDKKELECCELIRIDRVLTIFLDVLGLADLKDRVYVSRNTQGYTVEKVIAHSDGEFDISDLGVNSDVENLNDEDFPDACYFTWCYFTKGVGHSFGPQ